MSPTPRSLILDLLSTLPGGRGGSMPVRSLVEAAGMFEIAENSLRVALARLLAQDRVARDARGRYRIGPSAGAMRSEVRGWRRLEEGLVVWRGRWIAVHGRVGGRGADRARSARALRLLGFRPLVEGLAIRPDNLEGSVARTRARLRGLGLTAGCLVTALSDLGKLDEGRARALWSDADPSAAHRDTIDRLEASRNRLAPAPPEVAMAETFLLGGSAIRQLIHDPLLPEALASGDARRALLECLVEYDSFGRQCWAAFLERHGVRHSRTPADLRAYEDALPRAAGAHG